jgi:hypothetical protein
MAKNAIRRPKLSAIRFMFPQYWYMARNCRVIMDINNSNDRVWNMRNSADFHELVFIFSLGITPDMINNLILNLKTFNFCCMILNYPFSFNNKSSITSLNENALSSSCVCCLCMKCWFRREGLKDFNAVFWVMSFSGCPEFRFIFTFWSYLWRLSCDVYPGDNCASAFWTLTVPFKPVATYRSK